MADQDPNPTIASSTGTGGGKGPGGQHVGWKGIVLMSVYFVFITSLCLSGLVALWPVPTPSRTPPPGETITTGIREEGTEPNAKPMPKGQGLPHASDREPSKVKLLGVTFEVWDEVRLLLIVILCGALGSLVHGIRSFYWYVGNRELIWSWIGKYVIQPLGGASLAVVFYFVVRGGFFSPQAGFEQTSPFGFAALSAIVGLFSEQAVLKLKELAETMLTKPLPGKDARPQ
ncbi:MAG TPA: hypothetical protein VIT21_04260 [Chthoniobacterales bacterium]